MENPNDKCFQTSKLSDCDSTFYQELLQQLKTRHEIDFTGYKESTINRRISRRLALCDCQSIEAYLHYIENKRDEINALFHDLLIGVTEFFRDPEVFEALKTQVKELLLKKTSRKNVRIWVAGCATGQEAYTISILFHECAKELHFDNNIVIYATDAHNKSLAKASAGIYALNELKGLSQEQIKRYFTRQSDDEYKIAKQYRKPIVFAQHNLLEDPPLVNMDFISCRNVLIYFKNAAQKKLLHKFNFALNSNGLLLLGKSEGVSELGIYYKQVDKNAHIFKKIKSFGPIHRLIDDDRFASIDCIGPEASSTHSSNFQINTKLLRSYDALLARHLPPGVLITREGEIVHYFEGAQKYLNPASGRPSIYILDNVSGQVKIALSVLIQRINEGETRIEYRCVYTSEEKDVPINIIADYIELTPEKNGYIHITFATTDIPKLSEAKIDLKPTSEDYAAEKENIKRIHELENELNAAKKNLKAIIVQLQSTNEELQSVNEELYTVNAEYSKTNEELQQLDTEHQAILECFDMGIIIIDNQRRIQKFNRTIFNLMHLLPQDIGRPLEHVTSHAVDIQQILEYVESMFETREICKKDIVTRDGNHFSMCLYPFTLLDDPTPGAIITFSSLSEIREANDKLRISEERLSLAIEKASQGIWEINPITQKAYYSPTWYEFFILNHTANAESINDWTKLIHPNDEQAWWAHFYHKIGQDELFSHEFRMKNIHEEWVWIMCKGRVCERNDKGQATRVIGLITDISPLKKMELALRETERCLELSLTSANQVWWEWHIPSCRLKVHGQNECILNYSCQEIEANESFWWNRIPEEEIEMVKNSLEEVFRNPDKNWYVEHRFRDKTGIYRWVIEWGKVIKRGEDGKPTRMLGITQLNDISKRSQIELEENRQLYYSIVEDQDTLICRLAPDLKITYVNGSYSSFYNKNSADLIGKNVIDLISDSEKPDFQLNLAKLNNSNPTFSTVRAHECNDNGTTQKWVKWTKRGFFDAANRLIAYQIIGQDITPLKESEDRLRDHLANAEEARINAENANKAKSEFLAVMNHELRTPLNPIIAGSELLAEIAASEEQQTIANMIHSAGEHLLSLINSVLDLSKLEAEKTAPIINRISPSETIDKVSQFFCPLAEQKKIRYEIDISEKMPNSLLSDAFLIRQILMNIIGNAFKFTREGYIKVKALYEPSEDKPNTGTFLVKVYDSGIGIPKPMQKKIFEPFSQADTGVSRKFGGTGIGLAISKKSANLLGGDIEVSNNNEQGSIFTLRIPSKVPCTQEHRDKKNTLKTNALKHVSKVTMLVVDDDPMNREIIRGLAKNQVAHIDAAQDGIDAMHYIRKRKYDIILMDIHMPHMNGFETSKAIIEEMHEDAPFIIYLTADNRIRIKNEALKKHHGSAFLSKPLKRNTLLETIDSVMESKLAASKPQNA